MTPRVRLGVVSWNTEALLDRCLAALPAALAGLEAEVVVVDNASDDASAAIVRRHGVRLIENPENEGYARAMNRALSGTSADVLIALNPDTEPPPGCFAALVRRLEEHPSAGVVVPRLVHSDGTLQHSAYRFPSVSVAAVVSFVPPRWQRGAIGRRFWLEGGAPHDRCGPVDWAIGAVHVIRRAALEEQPPYAERWFMYAEDIELCWRLAKRGWRTWLAADVTVPHVGNAAGEQAWGTGRTARHVAASYDLYAGMHRPSAARWLALVNVLGVSYHLVGNLLGAIPRTPYRSRRRAVARGLARVLPVHVTALVRGPTHLARRAGVRPGSPAIHVPT